MMETMGAPQAIREPLCARETVCALADSTSNQGIMVLCCLCFNLGDVNLGQFRIIGYRCGDGIRVSSSKNVGSDLGRRGYHRSSFGSKQQIGQSRAVGACELY